MQAGFVMLDAVLPVKENRLRLMECVFLTLVFADFIFMLLVTL